MEQGIATSTTMRSGKGHPVIWVRLASATREIVFTASQSLGSVISCSLL
jgi:hypothetical protein